MKVNRKMYCDFLFHTQKNYTCSYYAEHLEGLNESSVYRYLKGEQLRPSLVWEKAKETIEYAENGVLVFDDTVLNKNYSQKIEVVRSQYSGCEKKVIRGIGVVTCLYYNPKLDDYWVIDYRIFDKDRDHKSKLDHVSEMMTNAIKNRKIPIKTVLMDSWYADRKLMLKIEDLGKIYYCPIKINRLINDLENGEFVSVEKLKWTEKQKQRGKIVRLKSYPEKFKQKLFQIDVATDKIEHIITNDMTEGEVVEVKKIISQRWKIEQLHRELKQLTGIEKNECRKNRSQRNHICCAMLVWHQLKKIAIKLKTNVYQVKRKLLDDYMKKALLNHSNFEF